MKHPILTFLLALGLLATAYGQQTLAVDASLNLSGSVSNWDRGEAELELVLLSEDSLEDSPRVAASTLNADGSFELTVPASVPDEALSEGNVFTLCGGSRFNGTTSEPTWREAFAAPLVSQNGEAAGLLTPASSQQIAGFGRGEAGDFFVGLLYVDRDLTIQGSCGKTEQSFVGNYDVALTEGWNQVVLSIDEITEQGAMAMSARLVTSLPEGTAWYFTPLEDLWRMYEP